ncbi:uncharacterized protein MONBRDRAFT_29478 [Monosiga brevicollis MX1]|uniref:DEP domain-containing protein n=1 Tax=Monosiga brevicollis TaxID=81824 RepID=A9VB76_MONBE|nr:uncharacterized protein MONBRDRAFT_29478 [Monosiga brevicollis MX1]EDQ85189.1 predicted protein [Monosiga brevicollis MX1]|eukprot:XP_001750014.1 hypothetical protein [Monosiga brevicollis MX1]
MDSLDAAAWLEHSLVLCDKSYLPHEYTPKELGVITFLAPEDVPVQNQGKYCGNLLGLAAFSSTLCGADLQAVRFTNANVVVYSHSSFLLALSGHWSMDTSALASQLRQIVDGIQFYHNGFEFIKAPLPIAIGASALRFTAQPQPRPYLFHALACSRIVCSQLPDAILDHIMLFLRPQFTTSFGELERRQLAKRATHIREAMLASGGPVPFIRCYVDFATNCRSELCFIGSEFVQLLVTIGQARDEVEATRLGERMLAAGLITNICHRYGFLNSNNRYYRFQEDEKRLQESRRPNSGADLDTPDKTTRTLSRKSLPAIPALTPTPVNSLNASFLDSPSTPTAQSTSIRPSSRHSTRTYSPKSAGRRHNLSSSSSTSSLVPAVSPRRLQSPLVSQSGMAANVFGPNRAQSRNPSLRQMTPSAFEARVSLGTHHLRLADDAHVLTVFAQDRHLDSVEKDMAVPVDAFENLNLDASHVQRSQFSMYPRLETDLNLGLASFSLSRPGQASVTAAPLPANSQASSLSYYSPEQPGTPATAGMATITETDEATSTRGSQSSRVTEPFSPSVSRVPSLALDDRLQHYFEHIPARSEEARSQCHLYLQRHEDTLVAVLVDASHRDAAAVLGTLPAILRPHITRCQASLKEAVEKREDKEHNFNYLTYNPVTNNLDGECGADWRKPELRYLPDSDMGTNFVNGIAASRACLAAEVSGDVILRKGPSSLFTYKMCDHEFHYQAHYDRHPEPSKEGFVTAPSSYPLNTEFYDMPATAISQLSEALNVPLT